MVVKLQAGNNNDDRVSNAQLRANPGSPGSSSSSPEPLALMETWHTSLRSATKFVRSSVQSARGRRESSASPSSDEKLAKPRQRSAA